MAIIAPIAGIISGGGFLGNLLLGAIAVGARLALAYFFPQKVEGPRAQNLKAQTSRYGDHISRTYGTTRTAGAVIWLKGNMVDEHSTTSGGKSLGPQVTSYTYTATFAVALAWNGPFSAVTRIWADDKLIYDNSSEGLQDVIDGNSEDFGTIGGLTALAGGAIIKIYLGTDDQESDPDIEADIGAGLVPAWPGLCYIVVKNLPLDEFGIRVPNIEAEVVRNGTQVYSSFEPLGTKDDQEWDLNGDYYVNPSNFVLSIYKLPGQTPITVDYELQVAFTHISNSGLIYLGFYAEDTVNVYDPETGVLVDTLEVPQNLSVPFCDCIDDINIDGIDYFLCYRTKDKLTLFTYSPADGGTHAVLWTVTSGYPTNLAEYVKTMSLGPEYGYSIFLDQTSIVRWAWSVTGVVEVDPITIAAATGSILICFYDDESDSVIIVDDDKNVIVMTPDLQTVLRQTVIPGGGAMPGIRMISASKRLKIAPDMIAIKTGGANDVDNSIYILRVSDLSVVDVIAPAAGWNNGGYGFLDTFGVNAKWDIVGVAVQLGNRHDLWYLPRFGKQGEPLSDVIDAECRHAGLIPDVTAIEAMSPEPIVRGYGIRDGAAPRGVLEDLGRVNFFDFAQVDGQITFFPRNTVSTRTLIVAETGLALNADPDAIQVQEEYPASGDLPEQVILSYPAYTADYRTGSQAGNTEEDVPFDDEPSTVDETGAPVKTRRKRVMEFSTSQVFTDDEAAQVIDIIHNEIRDAATVYRTTLGPKHLDLYPGEVIELPLDDSRTAQAVLTKQAGETLLECEFRKRGDSYTSDASGVQTPYSPIKLLGVAETRPVLIDGHLLRTEDDNDRFYSGAAVVSSGQFRGAVVYRSTDGGGNYTAWAFFSAGVTRGLSVAALPSVAHPWAIDRATQFTIAVPATLAVAPDSITEAQLLSEETSNAFAVWNPAVGDWEYIRAASVVDNGDKTWTLSTLLRGLKGTDNAVTGHSPGDIVYQLDAAVLNRATPGDRTYERHYVSVSAGNLFSTTHSQAFTNQGKGLRPWSPTHLKIDRDASGNITGAFARRDRYGEQWPDSGSETPALNESSEAYNVYVYQSGAVVRTISVTSESFSYSAAEQTTDFGSTQSAIDFGVVQVSAIYGDGLELREIA